MFVSVCFSRAVKTWNDFTPKNRKELFLSVKRSQKLLPVLHLYYKVAGSEAPRSCFLHCICTTKWLV